MLARLSLLGCLLPISCATWDSHARAAGEPGPLSSEGYWLARADAAEARGDWEAALLSLERWERDHPDRADHLLHERRLRLALANGDFATVLATRRTLFAAQPEDLELRFALADDFAQAGEREAALALLTDVDADPTSRLRAWRRSAEYLEESGDWLAAAEFMERAAADPGAGAAAPAWWERASWLWERGGDRARATRAIEAALVGMQLGVREDAALARLRAFELGEIASVEDASAVLRFHTDPELRCAAVRFLSLRRFPEEISVFGRALTDPDERVVAEALEQLHARFSVAEQTYVASCARGMTGDPRPAARSAAITLLGASGVEADLPLLLAALEPEDRAQFRVALRALAHLTGTTLPGPTDPDLEERQHMRAAWSEWWKTRAAPR